MAQLRVRPVHTADDREAVFALRHRCYLHEGAIVARQSRLLTDQFDSTTNTTIYGIFEGDRLIASIRLQLLTAAHSGSPTACAFPDIVLPLLQDGSTALDPTRFVVDAAASRRLPGLAYFVLRIPFLAADYHDVDFALASVRAAHMPFYRRTLSYHTVAAPRPYLQLTKPLGLMSVRFREARDAVLRRSPFFGTTPDELQTLFGTPATPAGESRMINLDHAPGAGV